MANIQQHTGTENLAVRIGALIDEARKRVLTVVNTTMVYTYYEIGRMIVEDEQNGQTRADYGKQVLQNVAKKLTAKYGKGFSYSNLRQMRQFYMTFVKSDKHRLSNLQIQYVQFKKMQKMLVMSSFPNLLSVGRTI